jgi:hypothetical protein
LLASSASAVSAQTFFDGIAPGEWAEVPNTKLEHHLPDPLPPNWGGPETIMGAWSGGAYDTKRDRLIVWGGGHADYAGNELYVFDVNELVWSRFWGPSPEFPDIEGGGVEAYDDGNPSSRHTYDGLEYIESVDRFWSQGGSVFPSGEVSFGTWTFDFTTKTWERKGDAPDSTIGVVSAYDSVTGHVFHQGVSVFSEYDAEADRYTTRGEIPEGVWEDKRTAEIDPVRRLFVGVGQGYVDQWDLKSWRRKRLATKGGKPIVDGNAPGFAYDPLRKCFVAWNGGPDVYTLDMETLSWTRHQSDQRGGSVPDDISAWGTYGRFRYVASKDVFIAVDAINENVFFYRMPERGACESMISVR